MRMKGTLKIKNRLGLHARPAARFVQTAGKFKCSIQVANGAVEVNGKSMMGLMMLAAEQGCELRLLLEGEDAPQALQALADLCARNFDE